VLFGFRSGHSLCLRLDGPVPRQHPQACAPASLLAHASAPILPVVGNTAFTDRASRVVASVSFGIAADEVKRVDVQAVDGPHHALLGGNAYLFIEDRPNTGFRVSAVTATDDRGRRTRVPLAQDLVTGVVTSPLTGRLGGPSRIQATIAHPRIGWYQRGENRGVSIAQIKLTPDQLRSLGRFGTQLRLVKPDPLSDAAVGLAGDLCLISVGGADRGVAWGCSPRNEFFSRGPINVMLSGGVGEFFVVEGAAADGVRRVVVFTSDRRHQIAALRDNVFTALVGRAQVPIKVVAYDAAGRVVGLQSLGPFGPAGLRVPPRAEHPLKPVLRVAAPHGSVAVLRVGRTVHGFRCWRITFGHAPPAAGCTPPVHGVHMSVDRVQPVGRDLFVVGHSDSTVVRIEIHFASNGDVASGRPVAGEFVIAIPRQHLHLHQELAYVVAYDRQNHRPSRQRIFFRGP
jgi:hypothetical protein